MTSQVKTGGMPHVSKADIVDLIAKVQGHRQRVQRGPEYLAECVANLRWAANAKFSDNRRYLLKEAHAAFMFDICGGRIES